MLTLIGVFFLSAMWCFGFHTFMKNLLIEAFDFDINIQWELLPRWVKVALKPLFACPYCMASVHGTAIFFAFVLGYLPLIMWPVWCICLCGFNYLLSQFVTE